VHLQSNHFKEQDYKFLANPDSGDRAVMLHGAKHLMKRIRRAVKKRSDQTDELALHIASCPYPVILCGDFNEPSFTYTYQVISKMLDDAFVTKGKGFGITYDQFPLILRLDYIFYNRDRFLIHSYHTRQKKLSDHYPITTRFSILPKSETTP
jgi:endonuclease/exonuclease/phosphatase (EEP) superfamily protein YafD